MVEAGVLAPQGRRWVFEKDGKLYTARDFLKNFKKVCSVSGVPLKDNFTMDVWGDAYLTKYTKEYQRCYASGRLCAPSITGGAVQFADGRVLSQYCADTRIDSQKEADLLQEEVRRDLEAMGFKFPSWFHVPVQLVEAAALRTRNNMETGHLDGVTQKSSYTSPMRGRMIKKEAKKIYAAQSLPRLSLGKVLAREMVSSYIFTGDFPEGLTQETEDGMAQLAAYLWLSGQSVADKNTDDEKEFATVLLRLMEHDKQTNFGKGLHHAYRGMKGLSAQQLFEYVESQGRLPPTGSMSNPIPGNNPMAANNPIPK